ncbi:hypothetical protein P175DRAFT_0504129 [Aspergillus ochraceoroseus IBT 24754]|uniref:Distal membrane-arm assembly complex protein 1-like domain-containing protein n=2 Tax=Aspergillus ochraceoroseus TaxID=138278 RepID=A0A2T5LPK8_9EURO|nr:uncharacterized protein P175DRAFT_0504129 [Aspergillus ochraceoroseus IBT 24754]KKK14152.1 hypothetical protein AOCH_002745 [Aspergillus ochraceoroseus]PTU18219.1 hypothetical protein P175DRAFT_0504129 [Aspergillus ochraceoroseus IBT 24754]
MAPSNNDSAWDVKSPEAKRIISEDQYDDCLSCRVTGSAAFIGLGVYSYYTGMNNLRNQEQTIMQSATKYKMGSRRLGIATISATLVGMGIWRAFN